MGMRYVRLFGTQLRTAALLAMQYRFDFVLKIALNIVWNVLMVVPLLLVYGSRRSVAGWSREEALLVVGMFTILSGVLGGAIKPAIRNAIDQVRLGTIDFLLLKPIDAQFLVSTSRFELQHASDVLLGGGILVWALHRLGVQPSAGAIAAAVLLLVGAAFILYSIGILCVSIAFVTVRSSGLLMLLTALFDAARWPSTLYRGALAMIFTFVIPIAIMTTYPALSLLGRLTPDRLLAALVGTVAFVLVARSIWKRSIASHTGAST